MQKKKNQRLLREKMGRKFKKMKLKNNKTMFNILVMKKFACG
jgi:hypothetical protein